MCAGLFPVPGLRIPCFVEEVHCNFGDQLEKIKFIALKPGNPGQENFGDLYLKRWLEIKEKWVLGVVHILRNQYFGNFYPPPPSVINRNQDPIPPPPPPRNQNQTSPTLRNQNQSFSENHFYPRFMLPCSL